MDSRKVVQKEGRIRFLRSEAVLRTRGSDPSAAGGRRSEVSCDRNKELKKRSDAQRLCFGMERKTG